MAVVIRLKRGGRTHAPYYRLVVIDSRDRNRGREIEQIGVYHPCGRPEPRTELDVKRALEWLYKGAQYSDTARSILSDKGVLKAFDAGVKPEDVVDTAPTQEPPAETPEPVAAPADEPAVPDTPKEDAADEPAVPDTPKDETADETAVPDAPKDEATVDEPASGE